MLHTGHALHDLASGRVAAATASTTVHFAEVTDAEIAAYVATGEPLYVAGAFTVDGRGGAFVPASRATTTTWSGSACRCSASCSPSSTTDGLTSGPELFRQHPLVTNAAPGPDRAVGDQTATRSVAGQQVRLPRGVRNTNLRDAQNRNAKPSARPITFAATLSAIAPSRSSTYRLIARQPSGISSETRLTA